MVNVGLELPSIKTKMNKNRKLYSLFLNWLQSLKQKENIRFGLSSLARFNESVERVRLQN